MGTARLIREASRPLTWIFSSTRTSYARQYLLSESYTCANADAITSECEQKRERARVFVFGRGRVWAAAPLRYRNVVKEIAKRAAGSSTRWPGKQCHRYRRARNQDWHQRRRRACRVGGLRWRLCRLSRPAVDMWKLRVGGGKSCGSEERRRRATRKSIPCTAGKPLTWSGCTRSRTADRVKYSIDCGNDAGQNRCCGNG